ncbi:NADPH-dependent F420 reductase [Pseudanabaena sp. FACHB-2040]|uniref:NADPH-dependent F420 reductase n=1 Tax=Pseudanabaena sp. FACHB-2040 TaxID=2692859 RepID=UPI001685D6EB|nr:NADPH-dependent F420 reductase [Pseudanabaena sp. FACHB-2040]MBD2257997.1 NADPH-dependent F420 reductase [Pseudanabaena sp. FACHB-2040]
MKIGIIGAGNMGTGLGKFWAKNGHKLMFSYSRSPEKLKAAAESVGLGVQVGTPSEAVQFADVVVLSIAWAAVEDALQQAGSLDGKIVFSCVNALLPDMSGLAVGTTTSAAEEIAKLIPKARLVEAMPLFAEVLHAPSQQLSGQTPSVFYCGDDTEAKAIVADLLRETGCDPIDAGPLRNARYIEPAGMLLVQLAYAQQMGPVAMKLLH